MTATPTIHSDLPDDVIDLSGDINIDTLLDHPYTVDLTIRFVCSLRKRLLSADRIADPDLLTIESIVSRVYDRIGSDRRQRAYDDPQYIATRDQRGDQGQP